MSQGLRVPRLVVFDFDGTIVTRDSFLDFSLRFCSARPLRLAFTVLLLPAAGLCLLRSLTTAASVLLWGMTLGMSARRFATELRRYAREVLPRFVNTKVLAELEQRLRDGDRVVIATGSVPLLVRNLIRSHNLPSIPVVGTRLARRWGGFVAGTHCVGQTKVRELELRLGITAWTDVYTDSFADHALLGEASTVTLVAPSRRTLSHVRLLRNAPKLRVL